MKNFDQICFSKETQNVVKSLARKNSGNDRYLEKDLAKESYLILHKAAKFFDPQRGFAHTVLRHALPKVKRIHTSQNALSSQANKSASSITPSLGLAAPCPHADRWL